MDSDDVTQGDVLEQLERVLRSPSFRSSKKCKRFLRYVVENMSESGRDELNERTLGVKVYGRPPDYDTVQDPVVRTAAVETRKRLALYYLDPRHENEIRISLPVGQYVPEVTLPQIPGIPAPEQDREAVAAPGRGIRGRWVAVAAAIGVVAACMAVLAGRFRESALDRFWAPFVDSQNPVLLCVVQPRAYTIDGSLRNDVEAWFGDEAAAAAVFGRPFDTVPLDDVVPQWGRYVALNHARAMTRISRALASRGKSVEIVGEQLSSFRDARARPTILIGPLSEHRLSSILTGQLRFYLDIDRDNRTYVIHDRTARDAEGWKSTQEQTDPPVTTEYAVVSRVRASVTGQPVIVVAATRSSGTIAAADFLTNESYFATALAAAPEDWYDENVQVVLSTTVINGEPGLPEIAATYFW